MPSPIFTINGLPTTSSIEVRPGGTVTCELVDISGVSPVAWQIEGTDDTTAPGDYAFVQSGSVGQTYTGTALTPGTCGTVLVTISGGTDPETGYPSETMTARGKFFVPTLDGKEVLTLGEQDDDSRVSSVTHGCVRPINEAIRGWGLLEDFTGTCSGGGTLLVLDYDVPDDCELIVVATVLAHDKVSKDGAAYIYAAAWKNVSGVVSVIGGSGSPVFTAEDDAAWGLSAGFAATSAQLTFTGDAANDTDVQVTFNAQLMRV